MSDPKPLLPKVLFDVRALLIMGSVSLTSLFGGGWVALAQVQEQAKESIKPVEVRVTNLEAEQRSTKGEIKEVQADIRALYKAVMTGKKQERLEVPPDGGTQ